MTENCRSTDRQAAAAVGERETPPAAQWRHVPRAASRWHRP